MGAKLTRRDAELDTRYGARHPEMLKVKAELAAHKDVSAIHTHVETNNGVVTLTGKARSLAEKELAGRLASTAKSRPTRGAAGPMRSRLRSCSSASRRSG